jgi:hypothetical protein
MRRDPHPLHNTMIQPGPGTYPVDRSTEALYRRSNEERVRALPTAATTRGDSRWRFRPSDPPTSATSPAVIFSPSDLEPGRTREASRLGSIADVVARLKP